MTLNGIFPDWMLPVTVGDAVSQVVNQGDLVIDTTEIVVEIFANPVDISLPDVVSICIIESAPVLTIETTPAVLSLSPQNEIIVERCSS